MLEPLLSDDALLADIAAAPRSDSRLDLWWIGQSGYVVQVGQCRIVFDPYLSDSLTRKYATTDKPHDRISRRVIDPSRLTGVDLVTSTHGHTDHLDAETLDALFTNNPSATLLYAAATQALVDERAKKATSRTPMDAGLEVWHSCAKVSAVAAAHDQLDRDAAGHHKYLGYLVRVGNFTVYHSGDGVVYDGLAESVKALAPIDVAILPINGKVGNMNGTDAARLAKAIGAKLVIPCHYDLFAFNTADPRDAFIPECERLGQPYRVLQLGERMTLTSA